MLIEVKSSDEILSNSQKRKGFHEKYLSVCKTKILQPLSELKVKHKNIHELYFHADRIKCNDWMAICDALRNDNTLKYVNIKLRKNDELVLEYVDTLKKSKSVNSLPAIYSKFLLTEFVKALQSMLVKNNVLEVLAIEGFPIRDQYMMTLAQGFLNNRSIRVLNLSRSKIGDEGCEILCSNISHLTNIETLNLSNCNISVRGVIAVKDYIKTQKIRRFSEAWIHSLRYQNIDQSPLNGLKCIFLNSNSEIGDEGLKILTDELCEDEWIRDIEMQNCGLSEVAANKIVACLDLNKTIMNFNVANNPALPDSLQRQILMRLGNYDVESYDSSTTAPNQVKITKSQLLDKIKYLEEQLESEIFRRKQLEELNDDLHRINIESKKQLTELNDQVKENVPKGFTLVANEKLERLAIYKSASNVAVRYRRKRRNPIRRVGSLVIQNPKNNVITSKSEASIKPKVRKSIKPREFIEHNIGDSLKNNIHSTTEQSSDDEDYDGAKLMQMFVKRETKTMSFFEKILKSSSRVSDNSDNE